MKKTKIVIFTFFMVTCLCVFLNAQWQTSGSNIYFNTGNTGIGLDDPQRTLDMTGRLRIRTDPVIEFFQGGAIQSYLQYHNASNTLRLYHAQAGSDQLVLNSDGFVGIGIEEPQRSLDMAGRLLIRHDPVIELYHNGAIQSYLQHHNTTNTLRIYHAQAGGNQLVIHPNGNVGIGCTDPTEKLMVKGTVKAEKIIVEDVICVNDIKTNRVLADYMFQPDYQLKQNHNLQNRLQKLENIVK